MRFFGVVFCAGLLLPATSAFAKAPQIQGFMRLDQLQHSYEQQIDQLKKAEAFAKLPREARMVEFFRRGADKFEGHSLDGISLVDAILRKWSDFNGAQPTEMARQVAEESLPKALAARYSRKNFDKEDRYKASVLLTRLLVDKRLHVRTAAIDCLAAIYNNALLYKPDAPMSKLRRWQHDWREFILSKRGR